MLKRYLNLLELLDKKSHFLFGARATGKSTLIELCLPHAQVIDLLHAKTYTALVRNPSLLEEMIVDPTKVVVIDEVHNLINYMYNSNDLSVLESGKYPGKKSIRSINTLLLKIIFTFLFFLNSISN